MKIEHILKRIFSLFIPYQIGFIRGHDYLDAPIVNQLRSIAAGHNADHEAIVHSYTNEFVRYCGDGSGYGMSFASGRMAFFAFLKSINIGVGDEVILPALTCSVMVNAVWRTGATPIFANIDPVTFGSSTKGIAEKITRRTKVIVAQHTFGIPCDVDEIALLAKKNNCYVVEDCALTFDSTLDGIKVGSFGDAAIFSTDHSKPINTLIGGFLFTKRKDVFDLVASIPCEPLTQIHQHIILKQLQREKQYLHPLWYPRKNIVDRVQHLLKKNSISAFLENDYQKKSKGSYYPYPAKLPAFLAQLGIYELQRWEQEKQRRKHILATYLDIFKAKGMGNLIPSVYSDTRRDIAPLRFICSSPNTDTLVKKLNYILDTQWIWWRTEGPIVCSHQDVEALGYTLGSCPVSETVCKNIFQLPCNIREGWEYILYKKLGSALEKI